MATTGLLGLGVLDSLTAFLLLPTNAAVWVLDPERAAPLLLLRAALFTLPGLALGTVVALCCLLAAGGVATQSGWGRTMGLVVTAVHLPLLVVALPLGAVLWSLPEPSEV